MVTQAALDGVRLGGLEVLPLHLQRPAVLELRLHPPHAQQVPEHHVVPERSRWRRNDGKCRNTQNQDTQPANIARDSLLQDGRREQDVQRPLDLVAEAQGSPTSGRGLPRRGVLRRRVSVPGSARL